MAANSIYDFSMETLEGQTVSLSNYRGMVVLIVNVATFWGSTIEEYHRLNALMDMYGHLNFIVLGFSCNQFGLQAPEGNHETLNVLKYVRPGEGYIPKFPLFGRIEVNGLQEEPLFKYLKATPAFVEGSGPVFKRLLVRNLSRQGATGVPLSKECLPFVNPEIGDIKKFYWSPINVNDIRWNFEKFLIGADGVPLKRYDLHSSSEELEMDIAHLV